MMLCPPIHSNFPFLFVPILNFTEFTSIVTLSFLFFPCIFRFHCLVTAKTTSMGIHHACAHLDIRILNCLCCWLLVFILLFFYFSSRVMLFASFRFIVFTSNKLYLLMFT